MFRIARVASVLALAMWGPPAAAQISAQVTTTLSDAGTGMPVTTAWPGQAIRVRTAVSWNAAPGTSQFGGIEGDQLVTPLGTGATGGVSNIFSEFSPGPLVSLGTLNGDDLLGVNIAVIPAFFTNNTILPPSGNSDGIRFIGYDWVVPSDLAIYDFAFRPSPTAPFVRLFPSVLSPMFIELPTTYTGARLIVLPGPGTAGVLASLPMLLRRRTGARVRS